MSLARRSLRFSFRQHCYGKSVCIFHESTHNRKGTSRHPKPPPIVIFPSAFSFCETPSICSRNRSLRMFRSHSGPNATGTILINGKSTGLHIQRHKYKRRDTRFSNKALHNSKVSYPPDVCRCETMNSHWHAFSITFAT